MDGAGDPFQDLPEPPAARAAERPTFDPIARPRPRPAPTEPPASEPDDPTERSGPRFRVPKSVVIAAAAALGVAAIGLTAFLLLRGSTAHLLGHIPGDVEALGVVSLDPGAGQKLNIARLSDAIPGMSGPTDVAARLEEWGDDALAELGLDYDDVTSWLGVEVAFMVDVRDEETSVAILAHMDERDGAKLMIAKLSSPGGAWDGVRWNPTPHRGVTVEVPSDGPADVPTYAYDGDVLVIASDPGFVRRIIDTHQGVAPSIETVASYQEAEAELPASRLVTAFVDTTALGGDLQPAAGTVTALGGLGDLGAVRSIGMSVAVEADGIALDMVASYDAASLTGPLLDQVSAEDHDNTLLDMVPADAWGVFAGQHFDLSLGAAIDEIQVSDPATARDLQQAGISGDGGLIELMTGDLAVALSPDDRTTVGWALLVGISEDAATASAVERAALGIAELLGGDGRGTGAEVVAWDELGGPGGVVIRAARELPVAYALDGGVLVVGTSVDQVGRVLATGDDTSSADRAPFARATAELRATDALFYVELRRVLDSIRDGLRPSDRQRFDEELGDELRAIRSISFGIDADPDRERIRVFVEIPPEEPSSA